jgi:hypothetical protein
MSDARPRSRWLFLLSPRWLTWHAFTVVSVAGMLLLGNWQLHRAETGNALSWGYTFEWPVFAIFVVVFWGKTILDEARHPGGRAATQALPAAGLAADDDLALPDAAHAPVETDDGAANDPELAAYNAYLARLNRQTTPTTREEAGSAP